MSEYRERATGLLKSKAQITNDNPDVSLPSTWNAATLDSLGVDPVLASPAPAPSGPYKSIVRDGAVKDANSNWVQSWTEVDMFTEYTDSEGVVVTVDEQIAQYEARKAAERRSKHRCTPRQARLALASSGSLTALQEAVQASGDVVRIEWEYATEIERSSPLIAVVSSGMGWTEEELDALFELAMTL